MREGSGEESSYPLYPLSCDNASTCMLGGKFLLLLRKLPFRRAPNARGPRPRHRVVQAVAVVLEGSHSKSPEFWELESFIPLLPKKRRTLDSLLKKDKNKIHLMLTETANHIQQNAVPLSIVYLYIYSNTVFEIKFESIAFLHFCKANGRASIFLFMSCPPYARHDKWYSGMHINYLLLPM